MPGVTVTLPSVKFEKEECDQKISKNGAISAMQF